MKRLIELRKKANKTQKELADYLKISRQAYANYENGNRAPDYTTLLKLADFFDVSVDYLLGKEEKPAANDELSEKNVKFIGRDGTVKYKKLSPEMISMLEQLPDSDENL